MRLDFGLFSSALMRTSAIPYAGCVSDALLLRNYLIDDLGMPEGCIQYLLGPENPISNDRLTPSSANIVGMLYSLITKPEIKQGDNIVVYYSGHGTSYDCVKHFLKPKCDTKSCPVEALCPLDHGGCYVPDISDRELNSHFTEIS